MKKNELHLDSVVLLFKSILAKHSIIMILFCLFALVYAVFTVNQLLSSPDDDEYRTAKQTEAIKTNFDQTTIKKVNELRKRQEQRTLDLPSGRINPFTE